MDIKEEQLKSYLEKVGDIKLTFESNHKGIVTFRTGTNYFTVSISDPSNMWFENEESLNSLDCWDSFDADINGHKFEYDYYLR